MQLTGVGPPPTGVGQPPTTVGPPTGVVQPTGEGPPPTGVGHPPTNVGPPTGVVQLTGVGPPPTGVGQPPTSDEPSTTVGQLTGVGPPPTGVGQLPSNVEPATGVGVGGGVEIGKRTGLPLIVAKSPFNHNRTTGLAGSRISKYSPSGLWPTASTSWPGLSTPTRSYPWPGPVRYSVATLTLTFNTVDGVAWPPRAVGRLQAAIANTIGRTIKNRVLTLVIHPPRSG